MGLGIEGFGMKRFALVLIVAGILLLGCAGSGDRGAGSGGSSGDSGGQAQDRPMTCKQLLEKVDLDAVFTENMHGDFKVEYKYEESNQCIVKVLVSGPDYQNTYIDFARVNIAPASYYDSGKNGKAGFVDDAGDDVIGKKSAHWSIVNSPETSPYDQVEVRFVPTNRTGLYLQVYLWGVNMQGSEGDKLEKQYVTLDNARAVARGLNNRIPAET
ncbi:hypothetical protein HY991_02710 [Candidatus Micrarchaeota archaeon]|nr:hypothetical protein [Candidatus Micrarchaeota archaeon]